MMLSISASMLAADTAAVLLRVASAALVLATAPLAIELLALTTGALLPRRHTPAAARPWSPAAPLALTIVVPAHNEEIMVARCVRSLLADLPPGGSVLVVAHNCTDNTAVAAADAGAEVLVVEDDGREGKGAALRAGFQRATGAGAAVLAVVDADSVIAPGFSQAVAEALKRGAESFQARYVVMGGEAESRTRLTALGFLGFNVIRPRGRSRLGLSAGIFGNGFGFLSSVIARVPYQASSLVEDLEYHLRLIEHGVKVEFLEQATVSSEMPTGAHAASSQRARWEGGRLRMALVWLPRLARAIAGGQMSAIEPALELASLPLASEVILLALALLLPVPWLRLYALFAFAVLFAHVITAAAEGSSWWVAVQTLMAVPKYIFWKLRMVPKTLASARSNAAWVRTDREEPPAAGAKVSAANERQGRSVAEPSVRDLISAAPVKAGQ